MPMAAGLNFFLSDYHLNANKNQFGRKSCIHENMLVAVKNGGYKLSYQHSAYAKPVRLSSVFSTYFTFLSRWHRLCANCKMLSSLILHRDHTSHLVRKCVRAQFSTHDFVEQRPKSTQELQSSRFPPYRWQ